MLTLETALTHRLGPVYITPRAQALLPRQDVIGALRRHSQRTVRLLLARRDPGAICTSLPAPCRFLSVHRARNGTPFWMITEPRGSRTTVLLPEDL